MGSKIKNMLKGFFEDDVSESMSAQGNLLTGDSIAQIRNNLNKAEFFTKSLNYEPAKQCLLENIEAYEGLNEENGKIDLYKNDIIETFVMLASINEIQGNDKQTIEYLLNSLEIDPKHEAANFKLGILFFTAGKYKKSISHFELLTREFPNKGIYFYYLGKAYEKAGKFDCAEGKFLEALKADPNFTSAHKELALLYCKKGDFNKALEYFQKIKEYPDVNSKQKEFLLNLGTLLQVNGDGKNAKAIFEEILNKEPENETAKLRLSEILIQERDFPKAEEYLKQIIDKSYTNYEARNLLYNLYQEQGKYDLAVEVCPYFNPSLMNDNKPVPVRSEPISYADKSISHRNAQGRITGVTSIGNFLYSGKFDMEANKRLITYSIFGVGLLVVFFLGSYVVLKGVISRVEGMAQNMPLKLIKAYQEKLDAPTKKRILARVTGNAQSYYELAIYYRRQNMPGEAENYYKEAIFAQPQEEQPYIELAEFYRSLGRNDDATKIYQKLFKVNPDNPKAFAEVEGYYKTLLSQQPQNEDAYIELAKVYERSGREEQVIEVYQQVLTMNPNNSKANYGLKKLILNPPESPFRKGGLYNSSFLRKDKFQGVPSGKSESAIETYRRTSQIDPNNPKALGELEDYYWKLIKTHSDIEENYLELGKVYEQADKKEKAAKIYQKLLKVNKGNKEANLRLIDYYKSTSPKKAVEYYENLIALEPQQENYYLELAALYNSCGKKDRAFKIYQTLLAINPNNERAKSGILSSILSGIKN